MWLGLHNAPSCIQIDGTHYIHPRNEEKAKEKKARYMTWTNSGTGAAAWHNRLNTKHRLQHFLLWDANLCPRQGHRGACCTHTL
jgi:hypothetical protein